MKKKQNEIYFASGETLEKIKQLPQLEKVLDKGYEVLYFTDAVDEFLTTVLREYDSKQFKSILQADLDLDSKDEKEELEKKTEEAKGLIDKIKESLKDKVADVKLSTRLKSHPVCLTTQDELSIEMEKVLKSLNQGQNVSAKKVLEINPDHKLFKALKTMNDNNEDVSEYTELLYDQALLMAGLQIEDPSTYAKKISDLMVKALAK